MALVVLPSSEIQAAAEDRWHKSSSFTFSLWDLVLPPLIKIFSTEQSHFLYFFSSTLWHSGPATQSQKSLSLKGSARAACSISLQGVGTPPTRPGCSMPLPGCPQNKTQKVMGPLHPCPPWPQHMHKSPASPKTMSCPWELQGDTTSDLKSWMEPLRPFLGWTRNFPEPRDAASAPIRLRQRAGSTCVFCRRGKVGVFQGKAFPLVHVQLKIIQWPTAASRLAYRETIIPAQFTAFWGKENLVI